MKHTTILYLFIAILFVGCDAIQGDDEPSIAGYRFFESKTVVDVNDPDVQYTLKIEVWEEMQDTVMVDGQETVIDTMIVTQTLTRELLGDVEQYEFDGVYELDTLSLVHWGGEVLEQVVLK